MNVKNAKPIALLLLMASIFSLAFALTPIARAERKSLVVDGPGFTVEKKKGWFGTEKQIYRDALGNTYEHRKGLFGRDRTESRFFGSRVTQTPGNTVVTAPDGTPLVTRKKSWWRGEETRVNGNGLWSGLKDLFGDPAAPTPTNP